MRSIVKDVSCPIQDQEYSLMKRLPVGIQTFRKLMDGNYLYVDKT